MSKITHPSCLPSTTLPIVTYAVLKKKKLYFRTNLKNSEKELDKRGEQRTAHKKFHADTASFTRPGNHLMKCVFRVSGAWLRLQVSPTRSAAALLFLRVHAPPHTQEAKHTPSGRNSPLTGSTKATEQLW